MRTRPQLMLTGTINLITSNYTSCIPKLTTRANVENHDANKKRQASALDVANKVAGGEHVLKENSHTAEHKIKSNTHIYINEARLDYFEEDHRTGEYEESDTYISVKTNLKKHVLLWQNTIKLNETVCDILKYVSMFSFLYTPSNGEFNNNSSAFENSKFFDESIIVMLRAGTVKEFLTKPKLIHSSSVSTKRN